MSPTPIARAYGVAQTLLEHLLDTDRSREVQKIFLGATDKFVAAHRVYENNQFLRIEANQLPASFPRMSVDTRFYTLRLGRGGAVMCTTFQTCPPDRHPGHEA